MPWRQPQTPNCYLRSELEDRISALMLSAAFGLSTAGTISLASRTCHDSVLQIIATFYYAILTLTLAVSVTYYAGWGTWIRRRIRGTLQSGVLVCCASACTPLLFGSGMHPMITGAASLLIMALALWTVRRKPAGDDHTGTFRLVWSALIMVISTLLLLVSLGNYDAWELVTLISLFVLAGIAYVFPYRVWLHAAWHFFALASNVVYYIIVWRHLS